MHYVLDLDSIRPIGVVGVGLAIESAGFDGRRWFIRRAGRSRCYERFDQFIADFIAEYGDPGEISHAGNDS